MLNSSTETILAVRNRHLPGEGDLVVKLHHKPGPIRLCTCYQHFNTEATRSIEGMQAAWEHKPAKSTNAEDPVESESVAAVSVELCFKLGGHQFSPEHLGQPVYADRNSITVNHPGHIISLEEGPHIETQAEICIDPVLVE
jgi:hypothetical protein